MPRTVPVMPTEAPGNFDTAALWNASVKALGDFLSNPPTFIGYQASAQAIANNTFVAAALDSESVDTDAGHSTVTNTSRYTFQVAGRYRVTGVVQFATNTTGIRAAKLNVNGGVNAYLGSETVAAPTAGTASTVTATALIQAAVGDYVELMVYQNSGGPLSTGMNTPLEYTTQLRAEWQSV